MNKRMIIGLVIALSCGVLTQTPASAHVSLRDETKKVGGVLHITPDDDPIAGQPANLYFDIQNHIGVSRSATLTIVNQETSSETTIPAQLSGTSITTTYTFPEQGVYELTLIVSASRQYSFTYQQRVSRGTLAAIATTQAQHPLATFALILSSCGLLVLLIIAFNHRREIHNHSLFK